MDIHRELANHFQAAGEEIIAERGIIAEAFKAQDHLRSMVEMHQQHEDAVMPSWLLVMLVAARKVC